MARRPGLRPHEVVALLNDLENGESDGGELSSISDDDFHESSPDSSDGEFFEDGNTTAQYTREGK